jgi:alpha-tubulin suppressor-like RCC1 family protein
MDGTARCWGANHRGQLGDDSRVPRTVPTPVRGLTDLVDISCGWDGAYAVTSAGTTMGWGSADYGALPGMSADSLVPVTIVGLMDIQHVSAFGVMCAVDTSSDVYCWGPNPLGQLGDGTTMERTGPVRSAGSSGMAAQVGTGAFHACVRNLDGTVLCFGHGPDGEIGDGGFASGLTNVTRLAVGNQHTCVVRSPAGSVLCWGRNDEGEIGDGSTTNRGSPVLVTLPAPAADVAAGTFFTCAILTDGSLWCWGANDVGQLGDGTTTDATEPVLVRF